MKVLVIDIGTNSVRYLVCDIYNKNNLKVIERGGEITRLGEGIDKLRILNEQAVKRTTDVIKNIIIRGEKFKVKKTNLFATSAARDAQNAKEFLQEIKSITGFLPEVLTGEEEAKAVFKGVTHELPGADTDSLITDIGGGSTEIVFPKRRDEIVFHSIDVGAVRMTERFLVNDPPLKTELDDLRAFITQELGKSLNKKDITKLKLIGLGGTITTLVAIHLKMRIYQHKKVHGFEMSRFVVQQILKTLSSISLSERRKVIGLQPERADIIVAGTVILDALLDFAEKNSFCVSDRGLLFGLALLAAGK